jgi:hypothetical protein
MGERSNWKPPGLEDGKKIELVLRVSKLPGPPPKWTPGCTETAAGMMAEHWTEEDDDYDVSEIPFDHIDTANLMIASVALFHDLTLATNNSVDFRNIPGLRLVDWLKP